jgi:hypothetical protein
VPECEVTDRRLARFRNLIRDAKACDELRSNLGEAQLVFDLPEPRYTHPGLEITDVLEGSGPIGTAIAMLNARQGRHRSPALSIMRSTWISLSGLRTV